MAGDSMYTEEERKTLDKLKNIRLDMVDHMIAGGIPDKVGELRILNEIIGAADKTIVDTATLRLKQESNDNVGAAISTVTEMLRQARTNKQIYAEKGEIPKLASDVANVALVEGEIDIAPDRLNPDDFIGPEFDPDKAGA